MASHDETPVSGEEEKQELPTPIPITSDDTLSEEFTRLSSLLATQTTHWQLRMHSLECLTNMCNDKSIVNRHHFVSETVKHQQALVMQLGERRSQVVRQACTMLQALSSALYQKLVVAHQHAEDQDDAVTPAVLTDQIAYTHLLAYIIDHLLPITAISIAVISQAAITTMHTICQHGATLYIPEHNEHALLRSLLRGTHRKHATVREHCYRAIKHMLSHMDKRYIEDEVALDPSATIPNPTHEPTTPIFQEIASVLHSGVQDRDAATRAAAREALSAFHDVAANRSQMIVAHMSPSSQKLFAELQQAATTSPSKTPPKTPTKGTPTKSRTPIKGNTPKRTPQHTPPTQSPPSELSDSKDDIEPSSNKRKNIRKELLSSFVSQDNDVVVVPSDKKNDNNKDDEDVIEVDTDKLKAKSSLDEDSDEDEDSEEDDDWSQWDPTQTQSHTSQAEEDSNAMIEAALKNIPSTPTSQREHQITLLSKLLDLENPLLTDKMVDFLLHDGVIEVLFSFISRLSHDSSLDKLVRGVTHELPPVTVNITNEITPRSEYKEMNGEESTATKRSFRVMQILCNQRPNHSLLTVLAHKIHPIVLHLLSVFHPTSSGNFYHTCAILSRLISLFPAACLGAVLTPEGRLLFPYIFDNLHEGPVSEMILTFLASPAEPTKKKIELFSVMKKLDWLGRITKNIMNEHSNLISDASTTFFLSLLERIPSSEQLPLLISELSRDTTLLDQMISCIMKDTNASWLRLHACKIILGLIQATEEKMITLSEPNQGMSMMMLNQTRRIANPLFHLKQPILSVIRPHVASIAQALIGTRTTPATTEQKTDTPSTTTKSSWAVSQPSSSPDAGLSIQFSNYTVNQSFTQARLTILKLLVKICELEAEQQAIVDIPKTAWSALVDWFFQYKHNTFFPLLFRRLIILALQCTSIEPIKIVLQDCKFITRAVAFYHEQKSCSASGFILHLFSHFRLTAAIQPSNAWLPIHLSSNTLWAKFLPELREITLQQSKTVCGPRPAPLDENLLSAQAFLANMNIPGLSLGLPKPREESKPGIDLGSQFAINLGYTQTEADVSQNKTSAKKKRKKKKKKKKAKKNDATEEQTEENDDEEGDEEGDDDENDDKST